MTSRAVLITGCSTGIGRATAERLARGPHPVYATARGIDDIRDLEQVGCHVLRLDVTDEASMRAAVEVVTAEHGAIGALVNNAGYSQSGALETMSMEAVRRQFETNVFGLLRLSQLVLPGMRAQGWGRIVNVSSMGGRMTFPGGGAYHATKHAVEALSDAMRMEVAGFGVDVVVIEPGVIITEFGRAAARAVEPDDGPYATFNAAVAERTERAYESGAMRLLGGRPRAVARVIERAIDARRPRTRYRITPGARLLIGWRRLVPDRIWDQTMGRAYPRPGSS